MADDKKAKEKHAQAADDVVKTGVVRRETPEQSVRAQVVLIDGLKPSDNGLLLAHTGGEWVAP